MSFIKKFLLLIFKVCLAAAGILAIFSISLEATILNPQAYKQALVDQRIYPKIPGWVAESIPTQALPGGESINGQNALYAFRPEDYTALLNIIAPADYIRSQTESLIDQFFVYLEGKQDTLKLVVDLNPLKKNLVGDRTRAVAQLIISTWPVCTAEDLLKITLSLKSADLINLPMCQPPAALMDTAVTVFAKSIQDSLVEMPESLNLGGTTVESSTPVKGIAWLATVRELLRKLPWVALALAVLMFFSSQVLAGSLKPFGSALSITGFLSLAWTLVFTFIAVLFRDSATANISGSGAGLGGAVADVFGQVGKNFLVEAGIISLVIGVTGLVISFLASRRSRYS